ncbi:hypothetical protein HMPREF1318_2342, partial [Actinomyces massiliensis F0489]
MSFVDALVYTLAYFPVISALARIDNPLPMPTTVHELRGQSYMRHRPSYAGILHEPRRALVATMRDVLTVDGGPRASRDGWQAGVGGQVCARGEGLAQSPGQEDG